MDAKSLRDRISRGMGSAARIMGEDYDLFRPTSAMHPLSPGNLLMRLPVVLDLGGSGSSSSGGVEQTFKATFDGIAVHVGDYLRGPRGVLFVLAMPAFDQPSCVLTNKSMDVLRPNPGASAGLGGYGGISEDTLDMVLGDWPVQVRSAGGGRVGALPADGGQTAGVVRFPCTPAPIRTSDILQDGLGGRFIVRSAEESAMGWRLSIVGTEV